MASTNKKAGSTLHPIWVGNLHDSVTESMLKQKFSGFGSIETCSIMRDGMGKTKNFGFVNFVSKHKAENAAKKLNGKELAGKPMKTKGPSMLKKEGHLKKQGINYRPLTDCTFFMEGGRCTKGEECPYRHSEVARDNEICASWMDRMCVKKKCPKRHPRLTESESTTPIKSHSHVSIDSDSDDSIDYPSYDDSTSDLSSNLSISPSPGTKTSAGTSPYVKRSVMSSSGHYALLGSTQSFSISSDEENDNKMESRFKIGDLIYSSSEDEDEDEDPLYQNPFQSLSRLTSLTEPRKLSSIDDNGLNDSNGASASSSSDQLKLSGSFEESAFRKVTSDTNLPPNPVPAPEPVGLFWDIENCSVPLDKSAFALANKMRQVFFKGKREVEFMCVCDITKERKEVTDDLHRAHVTLVHVNAIAKNAADDKLKHSLRRFAQTFHPPATVVLVSGDVNFSFELNDLRHVHHITTILVHNASTSDALKVCAHKTILFEDFIEDVAPQQRLTPPTSTILIAHGLPTMDPYKVRIRLSRLADNCGGKVLHVDPVSKTARILFKTHEYALKAQKRMTGEDVYGRKIKLEIESSQQKPNFQPRPQMNNRQGHVNPFPPPPPNPRVGPPMFYGPRGGLPFQPRGPHPPGPHQAGPHPPGPHPPHLIQHRLPMIPLLPSPAPPPPHMMPRPPQMGTAINGNFRFMVKGLFATEESEFDSLTTIFTDIRISVHVKANPPVYLWESHSKACLLSDFLLEQSADMKAFQPIVFHLQRGSLIPVDIAEKFVDICISDLNKQCQVNKIPWKISLCQWKPDEEAGRRTLSNIVSLLKKYDRHWAKFESFRSRYFEVYNTAVSEMMVQQICGDVIQLLSSSKSDTVILFAEFSPLLKIKKTDEFLKNSLELVESQPTKRIRLVEFVEAYQLKFGKLTRRRNGNDLQEIFSSNSSFFVGGNQPSALVVSLRKNSPASSVSPTCPPIDLATISQEFVQLVQDSPGQQVALNCFQQNYQTKFHKSFRVSDIMPGVSGVKTLIKACHGVKCVQMQYGTKNEAVVVLDQVKPQTQSTKTTPTKPSPTPINEVKKAKEATPKSTSVSLVQLELFRQDIVTLLQTVPGGRIAVSHIPDAYMKHFKRNYQLANYGGAKTSKLLKYIPETVMIDIEGDEKIVQLISFDKQSDVPDKHYMTKEQCEQKIEVMIYHLPNHQTTLDRFLYDYEAYYKDKLTNYCGHTKLLLLLQDMRKTIEINGTGARRVIRLVPLRLFACRMRELLTAVHPDGMKLSCVVPEYKKRFTDDFTAESYGKSKLLQVVECIPDIVKISGDGPRRVVTLACPALPAPPTLPTLPTKSPVVKTRPSSIARLLFMDEVTSLLFSYPEKELTLQKLCEKYYTTFKKQINLKELNYESSYDAVKGLSNMQVIGEGFTAIVRLKPDTISPEPGATPTITIPPSDPPQPSINYSTLSPSSSDEDTSNTAQEQEIVKPLSTRPRLCRTICVRLLSEIHRILLSHPEHSMTIEELCTCFKGYDEPSLPTPEDLKMAIDTYSGEDSTYKFNVTPILPNVLLVSLSQSDAMWKLSRDIVYLFVYCPCEDYTIELERLVELYKTCYGRRLNPLVYNCKTVTELVKSQQLKSCIRFNEAIQTISLLNNSRIEVFTQLACELLFRLESECGNVKEFTGCYEEYFKCPLILSQLQVSSLKELVTQPGVNKYIEFSEVKGHLTLTSKGLYCEQLRHLLTVHNGRIADGLLLTVYLSEFRHPLQRNSEILKWLSKDPVQYASHIANLACELYIIWSPVGKPYPGTRSLEQSTLLPDERSVTLEELGDVPELVSSVMNTDVDPAPTYNLTLPELISEYVTNDMPELVDDHDDQTGNSPSLNEQKTTEGHLVSDMHDLSLSATPTYTSNVSLTNTKDKNNASSGILTTPTNVVTTPSYHASDICPSDTVSPVEFNSNEITGLDHGEFAGLHYQSVVKQMQQEMRGEEMDTSAKIQRMKAYMDYMGEISELELRRVNPTPVPKPRRNKSKSRLAIQFPGAPSTTSSSVVEGDSNTSSKTSPVLGVDNSTTQGMPDYCLPQSNDVVRDYGSTTDLDWGQ